MAMNRAVFVFGMLYSMLFTLDIFVMFSQKVLFQDVNAYTLLKNLPIEAYPAALFWAIPGGLLFTALRYGSPPSMSIEATAAWEPSSISCMVCKR